MSKYKLTPRKLFKHLKTIIIHKYYVFLYMCKCGMPIQGLLHDMSKFSPSELLTNAKYYEDGISPIDVQKKALGYAKAWFHHKGHNPHHYEYWMDKFDDGCYTTRMPFKYAVEAICDSMAANKAYLKDKSNAETLYEWWKKVSAKTARHPDNKRFCNLVYQRILTDYEHTGKTKIPSMEFMEYTYNKIVYTSDYPSQVKLNTLIK